MERASRLAMIAKCVEDLQVFQKALGIASAVSAIIQRPALRRDQDLRNQLGASSSAIPSRISEGFEQKSDRHFAHYL
jgi:four helix bundle protein